jgi:hypothetical protein
MSAKITQRDRRRRRRGAVLMAALVCLLIVMAMLNAMLQGALNARRQLHRERDLRQTELLLQAGIERAAFQFAANPAYRGETWELAAEEIAARGAGHVQIEVMPTTNGEPRPFRVVAEYPIGSETSIRRSHTLRLPDQASQTQE